MRKINWWTDDRSLRSYRFDQLISRSVVSMYDFFQWRGRGGGVVVIIEYYWNLLDPSSHSTYISISRTYFLAYYPQTCALSSTYGTENLSIDRVDLVSKAYEMHRKYTSRRLVEITRRFVFFGCRDASLHTRYKHTSISAYLYWLLRRK